MTTVTISERQVRVLYAGQGEDLHAQIPFQGISIIERTHPSIHK